MDEINTLKEWIDACQNIVFFGGAGVSTESNIPDFRSVDGLYNQEYDYPPAFLKRQAEKRFSSCTAPYCATTACPAGSFSPSTTSSPRAASQNAHAAAL